MVGILRNKKRAIYISILTCLWSCSLLWAESFRVHKTIVFPLSSSGEKVSASAGINDALAIVLPDDLTFVDGIEILFKVPQDVAYWQDSVAWSLYNELKHEPSESRIDYKGTRITVGTFGNSLSLDLKVPLSDSSAIKKDAYSTVVDVLPDYQWNTLFVRLQLAMKGAPDSLSDSLFEISARPIFRNQGRLRVHVEQPDGESQLQEYTLFLDEQPTTIPPDGLFLVPGLHTISIVSDFYRQELRTVTVEQAKNCSVHIQLRDIAPILRIAAPDNAEIYLDDAPVQKPKEALTISQGTHTVRFSIGGYDVIKTVHAVNGRTYTVSVTVDASINEED